MKSKPLLPQVFCHVSCEVASGEVATALCFRNRRREKTRGVVNDGHLKPEPPVGAAPAEIGGDIFDGVAPTRSCDVEVDDRVLEPAKEKKENKHKGSDVRRICVKNTNTFTRYCCLYLCSARS